MRNIRGHIRRSIVVTGAVVALMAVSGAARYALADPVPVAAPVVAADPLPEVAPLQLKPVAAADARVINAAAPVSREAGPAASPFYAAEVGIDHGRAQDCLAAAAFFEAGDLQDDQRAVAQVVLNRVRHPAFPKTVCGVVFQGAERRTGCQFTFTCDGAMTRHPPSPAAWRRARDVAAAALNGAVYAPVGLATHYHADWVLPYWSSSLDRIARIGPHIFYRWTGWWGKPSAFHGKVTGGEPVVGMMSALSPVGDQPLGTPTNDILVTPGRVRAVLSTADDSDMFMIRSAGGSGVGDLARARALCGTRDRCTVYGWADTRLIARSLPLSPEQMDGLSFRYVRNGASKPVAMWNCDRVLRKNAAECMRARLLPA